MLGEGCPDWQAISEPRILGAVQAGSLSLSSKHEFETDGPQMDIGMVCPINGGVEIADNRP